MKDDEWSIEVKGRLAFENYLRAEDVVYLIQCSSNFRTGKGNPKKSIMPRKRGRHTTVDKVSFSKSLNISILTQMSSLTNLGKMMEEKLIINKALYFI